MSTHKVLLILRLECRMITKIFSCVLWVLMHIQLIWYAKVSFCRKDTQLQTFVNDKIQKGCSCIDITEYNERENDVFGVQNENNK